MIAEGVAREVQEETVRGVRMTVRRRGGLMRLGNLGFLIATVLVALPSVQAATVVVGQNESRQLTETTGFSWEQVNDICGAGPCSGSIGDVSFVNAAQ
jgi:hypothetical protein